MRNPSVLPLWALVTALATAAQAAPPAGTPPTTSLPLNRPRPLVARRDAPVRRTQADAAALPTPAPNPPGGPMPVPVTGTNSLTLEAALYGAITNNPDLVTLRNSNIASPEAVEVARRFPVTLNPTVWIDYRPITLIPADTFGNGTGGTGRTPQHRGGDHFGRQYFYISYRQPIELGHQTTYRYEIARAALDQQQWNVVQAELLAMVQTYRFFQTGAYRREKLRLANELAEFNDRLVQTLKKGFEASRVAAADVVLAEVENQATRQQVEVARQDYANALADLRNQLGMPENASAAEPLGEFVLPRNIPEIDDEALVQMALQCRPDIHAAAAGARGAHSAVHLAQGDRIPTPVVGPLYQTDEANIQYIGFVYIQAIPILNNGKPLVIQREADHRRAIMALQAVQQRAITQVKAAVAKWNASNRLVSQTAGMTGALKEQVDRLEKLFEANQATLAQLLQARQRLLQLQNSELDALWQATQAQSDLLIALGAPSLINALQNAQAAAPPGR